MDSILKHFKIHLYTKHCTFQILLFRLYSETSNKGHSERGQPLYKGQKWLVPKVSLLRGSTVTLSLFFPPSLSPPSLPPPSQQTYPAWGSSAIRDGRPTSLGTTPTMVLASPLKVDTSITPRSESVQYRLRPSQSTARSSGEERQHETTVSWEDVSRLYLRMVCGDRERKTSWLSNNTFLS